VVVRLADIVARLGGELRGAGDIPISRVAPLESAHEGDLSFLANPKYRAKLAATRASAVVMAQPQTDCAASVILTPQPYLYFARVSQWLNPLPAPVAGIHPSAVILGDVSPFAAVGPNCHVGHNATIAPGVVLEANCVIGEEVEIGPETRLAPNVTIYPRCRLGARCIVHAGAVIGSDGFGFARERDGSWVKIPQIGRVLIGDDVEIGAGTTIDRGAMGDTVLADGVKLDNQIQIGHNVVVGAHTAMAGCVGIAGSARIGARCTVGGGAVILGHLEIGDDVNISAGTLVAKSISGPGTFSGTVPFLEHGKWLRNFSHLRHLDTMADKIRALEERLAALESKQ
jgi:UDP-3-O-[3-hydroxymyristoyl] glucosamine N-acyltransferase